MTYSNRRINFQRGFIALYAIITFLFLILAIVRRDLFNFVIAMLWIFLTYLQYNTLTNMRRANQRNKEFENQRNKEFEKWFKDHV